MGDDFACDDFIFLRRAPVVGEILRSGLAFENAVGCEHPAREFLLLDRKDADGLADLRIDDCAVDVGDHPAVFALAQDGVHALNAHARAFLEFLRDKFLEHLAPMSRFAFLVVAALDLVEVNVDGRAVGRYAQNRADVRASEARSASVEPLLAVDAFRYFERFHDFAMEKSRAADRSKTIRQP